METTKLYQEGGVYARYDFGDGRLIIEKSDPRLVHDAPLSVSTGASLTISFQVVDFDGEPRSDNGTLTFEIDGVAVPVVLANGTAQLPMQLFTSTTISLAPPYVADARMEPLQIQVTL